MWLFMKQYRKLLALCAIPIVVAATFFGYRLVHAQSNQDEAFAVNNQMQSLLKEVDGATPVPTASNGFESPPKPKPTVKPTHSPKPKASAMPKATPRPSPVPTPKSTAKPTENTKPQSGQTPNYIINLNKATLAELTALPQIGESKAKAIIAYREQVNGFKTLEELVVVKGIGPKIFEKIKDHLEL